MSLLEKEREDNMSSLYKKNKKFYLLLILPALLLYSFAMLAPLFGGTIPYSFLKWNLMSGKKAFVGFDNYVKLFSDANSGLPLDLTFLLVRSPLLAAMFLDLFLLIS